MYIGIDIGGTKTLIASFSKTGKLEQKIKFPTPQKYSDFLRELANNVAILPTNELQAVGVALPGRIDRVHGIGIACGNLPWKNIPLQSDIKQMLHCPVIIENDANLAGLSEALLVKQEYSRVLYVTISTGIGTGVVTNQSIDPDFADTEGGQIILEHHGKLQVWEKFASGSAMVREYGKRADEINDPKIWQSIARNIAIGLIDLCAIIQPQLIILGGGVGTHFDKFETPLSHEMAQFATPLIPIPKIIRAGRPEEAVVYGCYELARTTYGRARTKTT